VKAWLKSLPARDLRAFVALMASIGGTMALTLVVIGLIYIFWRGGWQKGTELARIDKLGLIAVLVTVIMGVVMVSLGLAINRRTVKGSAFGASFEAEGGDDAPAAAQAVADSAQSKADDIKGE
jgi:amino acid transporter